MLLVFLYSRTKPSLILSLVWSFLSLVWSFINLSEFSFERPGLKLSPKFYVLFFIYSPESINIYGNQERTKDVTEERDQSEQDNVVEVVTPEVYYGADGSKGRFSGIWSRQLRVKVTGKDGSEKLEIRIPVSSFYL